MTTAVDKASLRRDLLARRQGLPEVQRAGMSRDLCMHLADWLEARGTKQAFLYAPVKAEPDLLALPRLCPGIDFALPVVEPANGMAFHVWRPGDPLVANRFKIPEPDARTTRRLLPTPDTVILTPCLALDRSGNRLGYGGGFYDRYLRQATAATALATLYADFCVEELPHEHFDARLDWMATEVGVSRIRP